MQKDLKKWMGNALLEAEKSFLINEVPIGAVVVHNNQVIGRAHNLIEISQNPTFHAEMLAIQEACNNLHSWRLNDCDMYVTIEPCLMCAGAICSSRINHLYYGAPNRKFGAIESLYHVLDNQQLNHHVSVKGGILDDQASNLMKAFFKRARRRK
ncbi:tRNA-specific adenosine deaminase [Philodulcilactobacillus myokoensis]|uniref:tRNA-specific adenosine deaminase n=1 Tax=Philodulcilactobacillus myokoensis TaxID=2929573 RepID=A0A9W6ESU9_9LACO|nr:nucleoside deaminase [Philodulcilactobacillus myokoensis]GLB47165.1 tRNA-specific adenosine deaminase [Philodulcilactobacillus myokoensis]